MRLPMVVPLGHALQRKASAVGVTFQLCEKEFGQLHIASPVILLIASGRIDPDTLAAIEDSFSPQLVAQ